MIMMIAVSFVVRTLTMYINPLNDASHPDGALLNIATGQVCPSDVNVDD